MCDIYICADQLDYFHRLLLLHVTESNNTADEAHLDARWSVYIDSARCILPRLLYIYIYIDIVGLFEERIEIRRACARLRVLLLLLLLLLCVYICVGVVTWKFDDWGEGGCIVSAYNIYCWCGLLRKWVCNYRRLFYTLMGFNRGLIFFFFKSIYRVNGFGCNARNFVCWKTVNNYFNWLNIYIE